MEILATIDRPSNIPANTELIAISLTLKPDRDLTLHPQSTTQLHGWFLHQIRRINPELSQQLHDGQGEKAFTISQLQGSTIAQDKEQHLSAQDTYQWQIVALSRPLCDCLRQWLDLPPTRLELNSGNYQILDFQLSYPPTTYSKIWHHSANSATPLELTFTTATSFRKRGNHMPLPIPENLFHSYLRRWNHFSSQKFDQDPFLDWVNEQIVILRHDIRSVKVQASKSGSVTGFVGSIQLGFTPKAKHHPEYIQLVHALIACAPYFNTGHKVTFGLGHTELGWGEEKRGRREDGDMEGRGYGEEKSERSPPANKVEIIAARERELEPFFLDRKKRQGGERARKTAKLWAQIIARLELGESLNSISIELNMPYDTVKKYAQIAKKQLQLS
jgi:CRISPR-associated endoribonuclease Cas6